jgi:hypothetical protein
MKVKLLSFWIGPRFAWWGKYVAQWQRFKTVEWEHIDLALDGWNRLATQRLSMPCNKGSVMAVCDYRPAFNELFADKYSGCDWWGWVDPDMLMGDLDTWLPKLLTDDVDAVSFKQLYLSGCFAMFRNTEKMRTLWRRSEHHQTIMVDPRYNVWDESGYRHLPGESFFNLMLREGIRIKLSPELYAYDALQEQHSIRFSDGKLFNPDTGEEKVCFHFMSKTWPINDDGSSR